MTLYDSNLALFQIIVKCPLIRIIVYTKESNYFRVIIITLQNKIREQCQVTELQIHRHGNYENVIKLSTKKKKNKKHDGKN